MMNDAKPIYVAELAGLLEPGTPVDYVAGDPIEIGGDR
jgi:hypothetical protein